MTDTSTVQNAADLIDKWAAKLVTVAEQHGPQVAELAMATGQIGAAQTIVQGGGSACIAVAAGLAIKWGCGRIVAAAKAEDETHTGAPGHMVAQAIIGGAIGFFSLFALVIGTLEAFSRLTNVYAWAGLWRPEIYLAAKALGL